MKRWIASVLALMTLAACDSALSTYGYGGGYGGGGNNNNSGPPWHVAYVDSLGAGGGVNGSPPADNTPYQTNDLVTIKGAGTLTWTGWTFDGWNTMNNGGINGGGGGHLYHQNDTFLATSNVSLYAQWHYGP